MNDEMCLQPAASQTHPTFVLSSVAGWCDGELGFPSAHFDRQLVNRYFGQGPREWTRCLTAAGVHNEYVAERLFELVRNCSPNYLYHPRSISHRVSGLVGSLTQAGINY